MSAHVQGLVRFCDLVETVVRDHVVSGKRGLRTVRNALRPIGEHFGLDEDVRKITYDRICKYAEKRLETMARASVRLELDFLKRGFRLLSFVFGVEVPRFPIILVDNARHEYWSDEDLALVLAHLPEDYRPWLEFIRLTGWRRHEATGLLWAQVDFDGGAVKLLGSNSKNRSPRIFPFAGFPRLKSLLELQRKRTDEIERQSGQVPLVFWRYWGGRARPIPQHTEVWDEARRKAGLFGKRLHDFRRTVVRDLERARVPRSVAMRLTGHKTEAVYRRYAITCEQDLLDGVERYSATLGALFVRSKQEPARKSRRRSPKNDDRDPPRPGALPDFR